MIVLISVVSLTITASMISSFFNSTSASDNLSHSPPYLTYALTHLSSVSVLVVKTPFMSKLGATSSTLLLC